jgi:serine/threonine protein phosphatase PrpC
MAFQLDIGFTSLAGSKEINEDFCAAMLPEPGGDAKGAIAAIADGVSTGGMGKEAAQTTVTSLVRDYYDTPDTWETTVALDRVIAAQNTWLASQNRRLAPALGLTTLTALVLRGQTYTLAHVGDTRAYLLRAGTTTQLTNDHSVTHADFKHQLLRAVGFEDRLLVDYSQGELLVGDVFVLVSDGVHGVMNAAKMRALTAELVIAAQPMSASQTGLVAKDAANGQAQVMSEALVNAALHAGSQDNTSALVIRVLGLLDSTLFDQNRLAQLLPIPEKLKVGAVIDGLAVTSVVADNGINIIYQVRDVASKKLYALKSLHPARAHDHDERAMLAHEAWVSQRMQTSQAAASLVQLHELAPALVKLGQEATAFYLLYSWHGGETMQQLIDRQVQCSVQQALSVTSQTLKALGALHRQNVIHRDVKPANLHQGDDGVLRLLDLGVALTGREPESMRKLHAGTPSFVNPEQWGFDVQKRQVEAQPANAQSDLFALGVTLYQMLTLKLPFGDVLPYQSGRYRHDPVPPSRHNPEVPIWLDHVVLKAVALDHQKRFETAEEFLLAVERGASRPLAALGNTPLLQRDPSARWKIALGLSLLFNLALIYWLFFLPTSN